MTVEQQKITLLTGYNKQQSKQYLDSRTVNMYVVREAEGKTPGYLLRTPGLLAMTASLGGVGRALFVNNNLLYGVAGSRVFSLDTSLVATTIGTLTTASGFVSINANERTVGGVPQPHVIFVDGVKAWVWDSVSSFSDTGLSQPLMASYLDNRMYVPLGTSSFVAVSNVNDATTYPSINQIVLSGSSADQCQGSASSEGRLYIFGSHTINSFYDAGGASPPAKRDTSFFQSVGLSARGSLGQQGSVTESGKGAVPFLANNQGRVLVMQLSQRGIERISDRALEDTISDYTNVADAIGFVSSVTTYPQYHLSFTTDDHTFFKDESSEDWFEKEMLDGTRDIINAHAFFNGTHYGLGIDGVLYAISPNYLDNNGEPIRRLQRLAPFATSDERQIAIHRFQLNMPRGIGLLTPNNTAPVVRLKVSKDGGQTFGNTMELPLSPLGDGSVIPKFDQVSGFADGRNIVFEYECTNQIDFNVYGGVIYYSVGVN